jgi:hypothetical protein
MTRTMHAVGYRQNLTADDRASLGGPYGAGSRTPAARSARAGAGVSVNPVDTKFRRGIPVAAGDVRILGFDAAGTGRCASTPCARSG